MIPATILFAGIYFFADPALSGFFPKCPFHSLTGLDCPGCGSQRAVHELLHGRLLLAADYNLLLVISLPLLLTYFLAQLFPRTAFSKPITRLFYRPFFPWMIFAVVVLFWVTRNLNFAAGNYLAA
ncbi:MAG: DUF2752 domain-containing protein [Mucilaginibacter polytrichastri]|nr:DUF2752 domain-containing protein [Mucilaginibacter polytrichastri]